MMKNKKGLELSVNFLVILIIAIVVFGFGLAFVSKFFAGAKEMKAQLDSETQKRIEYLLNTGEQLVMPVNTKTIQSGKNAVFGIGILNILGNKTTFMINLRCTLMLDKNDNAKPDSELTKYCKGVEMSRGWLFSDSVIETVENNEQKIIPILISVPQGTPSGKYVFTVTVTYGENNIQYDVPRKIYVIVP